MWWARSTVADILTLTRIGIAVLLVPSVWSMRLDVSSLLLAAAWMTDVLDGRLAPAGGFETRLGRWDVIADTMVGGSVLIGLAGAGQLPVWLVAVSVVGLGWWFLRGNLAASMLLQLAGYLPLLRILWVDRPSLWWLPFLVAATIGVVDWRRLVTINIAGFVAGLTGWVPDRQPADRLKRL